MNLSTYLRAGYPGLAVITAEDVTFGWGDAPLAAGFNTTIFRGDKIGLMGPNGCGKTTLLKLLLGQLAPHAGTVTHGTKLEIAYFDQQRETLNDELTVAENIAGTNAYVMVAGRLRHILGYLEDFLFPPERARTKVRVLSGGERNRLLLARLFTKPSNLLVLDEPTNDLDAETLELLEDLLVEYSGTILLVSHDREFVNNVVSDTLVFEGDGRVTDYVGGYDDWLRQRPAPEAAMAVTPHDTAALPVAATPRMSRFKARQELAALPGRIEQLDAELAAVHQQMTAPDFFKAAPDELRRLSERAAQIPRELEAAYALWQELEQSHTAGK